MKMLLSTISLACLIFSSGINAKVVVGEDQKNQCTLYRVIDKKTVDGVYLFPSEDMREGEKIFNDREQYGLTFKIQSIDFEKHKVKVKIMMSIIAGANRWLDRKTYDLNLSDLTSSKQKDEMRILFTSLNKRTFTFSAVCLKENSEIAYITE
ncbi:MAG: hypothetical protein HN509_08020 [Halobacteriovoraceae bacterium]|jgi:hypothetical protein|nr:hypothetical protein [Halobacteriovoraceae bacterium]